MKNKPLRHKEKNRFQFKPFSERINDIDIDVFHRVTHRNEDYNDNENETYFYQTMQKWNVINLTKEYCEFKKEVREIVTLPQLLNQKQLVIDILKEYLKKKNILFLQPILELTIAVARDLQKEFYEYFPDFLTILSELLQTKDSEQIEYVFTTLAYLLKFLWRFLIKNIPTVFKLLLPLLGDTQPAYINNFAAESFAFIVRKVKDKESFIKLVLRVLKTIPNGIPGCGKLLFEVIYGTSGQFHSCAEGMLLLYFKAMQDNSVNQSLLFDVLTKVIECILLNIHPQKSGIFWKVLLNIIDIFSKHESESKEISINLENIKLILQHLHFIINFQDGRMLVEPIPLTKKLVYLFKLCENEFLVLKEVITVSVDILLAPDVKLLQETSSQLLIKIMSVNNTDLKYTAIENLINYTSFNTLVLPHLIRSSTSVPLDSKLLKLCAKIIKAKSHPCLMGNKLIEWKKFTLDLDMESKSNINYCTQELGTLLTSDISVDALNILLICPHLRILPESVINAIKEGLLSLYNRILQFKLEDTSKENMNNINKYCFIFLLTLESAIHSLEPSVFYDFINNSNMNAINLLENHNDNIFILCTIDLVLTYFGESEYKEKFINVDIFDNINMHIKHNLESSNIQKRLVSTHIYSLFFNVKDLMNSPCDTKNAMELMYLAECEKATIHTYRDKLLHLQSLSFNSSAISKLHEKYYEIPLRYLMGNLYINFSLLWDPVIKIISSYSDITCTQFWPVFYNILNQKKPVDVEYKSLFEDDIISELETQLHKNDDKPDYDNYKILLYKCMAEFPKLCEAKNRDLTGLLIDFVNNNFFKSNSDDAKSCNIKKYKDTSKENLENMDMESDKEENEEDEEEIVPTNSETVKIMLSKNLRTKLLLGQLLIFSKMSNPKTFYREQEVQTIFRDLLLSRNADIQKAALNCLLTYKYKFLVPYKDQLLTLIDEKNLKNELARFKVDTESDMVDKEHRPNLMPILLRIIYAKMIRKTGMRTGGKTGGLHRRKLILRFLAGIQEDEMIEFINMVFKPFKKYESVLLTSGEELELSKQIREIISNVDLSNVIPPKRLQSAVNLLGIIMEQFGAKMENKLLPRLLRMLMCILSEVTGIIKQSDQVHPGCLQTVKNVRNHCIIILGRFFSQFENYKWSENEIDALFDVAVFPWLEKLPVEGIHAPTALLKLFAIWSENPRYFPLLIKHHENDKTITPLPFIVKLLLTGKTHLSVINTIVGMLEKLLTLQDYGKTSETDMEVDTPFLPMVSISNLLPLNDQINGVNYGSAILLPHITDILLYLKNKLNRFNKSVNKSETIILSRISEFVKDAEICDTLLTLLLPILNKKASYGASDEIIIEMLTTVGNLIKIVHKPEIHIKLINPLLNFVSTVQARKFIIQLYNTIASRSAEENRDTMLRNSEVLTELNAWDRKWIDQPDFQKRLDAFSKINELLEKNELMLEFGVAIIYNCFFYLRYEADLALRDCAGQCLQTIGPKLAKEHKNHVENRRYLVDDTILVVTKKGITNKNEVVRLQSIALIGIMSMECSDVHHIFRDLSSLTNKVDPEVDFFENMQHLQLHRRARALLRFCSIFKTLKKPPNPKTLTQFILPLASYYLCNENFVHKNSIIDAAIETVGVVCKLLPWYHYELILKVYLLKLRTSTDYQKQIVRLLVIILDSFHFDLAKFNSLEETVEPVKKLLNDNSTVILSSNKDNIEGSEEKSEEVEEKTEEEELNEELSREDVEIPEEVEDIVESKSEDIAAVEKRIVMSQQGAQRIVNSITKTLLPQLHRAIASKTHYEKSHKVNKKKTAVENEEDYLLRVPIALALVKLLQKLPKKVLDTNLPGIFMKICTFLKSRLESVRRTTREILQDIMITLGPEYLNHLLAEMNTLLTKGFQVHVLAFTVYSVLKALKPHFKPYQMNDNLQSILSVCKVDLFGMSAEEKEVAGIGRNVTEAKSTKSYLIFNIMAEFITESCLLDLILPLKNVLAQTHSHKTVVKVSECLRNVVLGLVDNKFIPLEKMLIFLYGVVSESIPQLQYETEKKLEKEKEKEKLNRQKADCYIIAPEPKSRMGFKTMAKTAKATNAHIMVEFGLKVYHILLKREKISNAQYSALLNPLVSLLSDCLKSQHVKLSTLALQCLNWLLKLNLESVQKLVPDICSSMFAILHKYAASGLSKGDNFDLVMATFKCMSVLVRDVKHYVISTEQLKLLVLYCEQDIYDSDKQATAFTLIKAIINRKLVIPEMHPVLEKIAALSISSELEHIRVQSRSVFYMYLMEYPLGKHLEKHVVFYLSQLSYEMQSGRLSAYQMIHNIITGFPIHILVKQSAVIFIMAGARLINDEDPLCRKQCAKCIKELLMRLPREERNKLFGINLNWLKEPKVAHRTLAAQLCGIFVAVEKDEFKSRLEELLSYLLKQFYVEDQNNDLPLGENLTKTKKRKILKEQFKNIKDPERMKDHHLFQVLQLLLKISTHCSPFLRDDKYKSSVKSFAEYAQQLLGHPHLWVRLAAAQLIGFIMGTLDIEEVSKNLKNTKESKHEDLIYASPETIRSLSLDLIAQLYPDMTLEDLSDQVVKNLIFIAKILNTAKEIPMNNSEEIEDNENANTNLSLLWLLRKLRKSLNVEITQSPKSISVRTAVFKWIAGVVTTIPIEDLNHILFNIMSPLVRELTTTEEFNISSRKLAKEVSIIIKKRLGNEEYNRLLSKVQQKLNMRKVEKKKIRTQQFVTDPELAAKRKVAKQQKKKEAKKRKLENTKGKRPLKKKPRKEVEIDDV